MADQTTPQAGSSRQGYQALQFPEVTPRRMIERPQLEAPPTESEDDDQHMEHILSRGAPSSGMHHSYRQDYSADEMGALGSLLPAGFTARFEVPQVRRPPSNTSTRQQVNTREARESPRTRPQMSQKQYDSILERVIPDGKQEFNRQRKEISNLTERLIVQTKLQKDQQEAHERTYNAAKAIYDELAKPRSEVEAEVAALKRQAEGQGPAVTTFTENITRVLKLQWKALTSKLQDDTQSIINAARTEFDMAKMDLGKLEDWTQRAIKQEQDDRMESCEINKYATETLSNKVQTF